MKNWLRKNAGLIYIILLTLTVIMVLVNSDELPRVMRTLRETDAHWVWAAAGCTAAYLSLRAVTMWFYIRSRRCKFRFLDAMLISGIGQFYSAITPSASGGQPLQVLSLHQRGVPAAIGTAAVSIKLIGFQLAYMVLGGALWCARIHMVADQLGGARWLVALGYLINLALVGAILMTMVKNAWVDRALNWTVRLGVRLRAVKDEQRALHKAHGQLDEYRRSLLALRARPLDAAIVFALSLMQVAFLMAVVVALYRAFKLTGTDDLLLLTLQFLLYITAAFVPLPGAAGAQEGGFYLFFHGIVPEAGMLPMLLCWRFFTYYLLLIVGFIAVAIDGVLRRAER